MPALSAFDPGSDEYPDRSTTLIVQVGGLETGLEAGAGLRLTGPGIRETTHMGVTGLTDRLWEEWRENRALFPGGVDLILTYGHRLTASPRHVEGAVLRHVFRGQTR